MAEVKYYVCDACGVDDRGDRAHMIHQTKHAHPSKTEQLWLCRVCAGEIEGALYEALGAKLAELRAPRLVSGD